MVKKHNGFKKRYLVELGAAEEAVDFIGGPNQGQALLVRQKVKIGSPGRALTQALLVHKGHSQTQRDIQGGGLDELRGCRGPDSEAGELGDGGDQVAMGKRA